MLSLALWSKDGGKQSTLSLLGSSVNQDPCRNSSNLDVGNQGSGLWGTNVLQDGVKKLRRVYHAKEVYEPYNVHIVVPIGTSAKKAHLAEHANDAKKLNETTRGRLKAQQNKLSYRVGFAFNM